MVSKTREDIMLSAIPRDSPAMEGGESSNGSPLATNLKIRGWVLGALSVAHSSDYKAVHGVISGTSIGAVTLLE